ncbi:stage III sporulation protein AG [Anaerofilum sp. BX8]|uniref:Stage III sporulation protein AG n=1 Tax=Anaerofilum hominis TaxID=2763016 RepID=A0A923ID06_9FIRM|nr:stage III sporulation protein AG [Anaerofilum hominis]MBC5579932.1 stage III sporulation protein AG [Anaerofilum hominis]
MELKKLWERFKAPEGKKKRTSALFLLGLAGILLIFLSDLAGQKTKAPAEAEGENLELYVQKLEERLLDTVKVVQGVGKVKVMLTLEGGAETVYAFTEKSSKTQTVSDSGANSSQQSSYENEFVLVDAGSGRQALVETAREPEIKGVAIVCEGGDDVAVVKRITDVVSVVLGIPTNRICVTKMT